MILEMEVMRRISCINPIHETIKITIYLLLPFHFTESDQSNVRQELMSVGCARTEVIEKDGTRTTTASQESYGHPLILFMLAQLLLGCGGSPLFTLGITYVDDHVPADSSSVYIGKFMGVSAPKLHTYIYVCIYI